MIPVVGMLAASGILKGLLALLVQFKVVTEASNTFHFIAAMSSSMFFFLPIVVGFTAAKRLGADPIVVAIIGGVLCYPSVVDMSKNTDDVITVGRTVFNADFFGIPVSLPAGNAYAYHNKKMNQKDGDIAWRDEDGYYWFVSRADDVIKSSGYRIGPFEVESALMSHPAVIECAITGVPDEIRGLVVKATIVLADEYKGKEGPELIKELQTHVKHETAPYKYPRVIEFVDELPKTISGKIRRVEIRENDTK